MNPRPVFTLARMLVAFAYIGVCLGAIVCDYEWAAGLLGVFGWFAIFWATVSVLLNRMPKRAGACGFLVASVSYSLLAVLADRFPVNNLSTFVEALV